MSGGPILGYVPPRRTSVEAELGHKYLGKVLPVTLSMGNVLDSSDSEVNLVDLDKTHCKLFADLLVVLNLIHAKSVIFVAKRWIAHQGKDMDKKRTCEELQSKFINDDAFRKYVDKRLPFRVRKAALSSPRYLRKKTASIGVQHFFTWVELMVTNPEYEFINPQNWRMDFIPVVQEVWDKAPVKNIKSKSSDQDPNEFKSLLCPQGLGLDTKFDIRHGGAYLYLLPGDQYAFQTRLNGNARHILPPSLATRWRVYKDTYQIHTQHLLSN